MTGRQLLQHHHADRFPSQTFATSTGRDAIQSDYPELSLYRRHFRFLEHFGAFLFSSDLNPCFQIRLGSDLSVNIPHLFVNTVSLQVDFNAKAYGCQRLLARSSEKFVGLLASYLYDFLKSLYAYVRGAYLLSRPNQIAKIDKLDLRLDQLLTELLDHDNLIKPGGLCLTPSFQHKTA